MLERQGVRVSRINMKTNFNTTRTKLGTVSYVLIWDRGTMGSASFVEDVKQYVFRGGIVVCSPIQIHRNLQISPMTKFLKVSNLDIPPQKTPWL